MTDSYKMVRIENCSWKKDGQKRHGFDLMFSHKKTTQTLRREKQAYGAKDSGTSPSTNPGEIGEHIANVVQ